MASNPSGPDAESARSHRVHLVAASLALAGTMSAAVGFGLAIDGLFSMPRRNSVFGERCLFVGLTILTAAKLTCLADGGRLVGMKWILTALASDFVAASGVVWVRTRPHDNFLGLAATFAFLVSEASFAFYWAKAAGAMKSPQWQPLLRRAMIGFLATTAIGLLFLIQTKNHEADSTESLMLVSTLFAALATLIVTLFLWVRGLAGLAGDLVRSGGTSKGNGRVEP